jgi:hypothetical protein
MRSVGTYEIRGILDWVSKQRLYLDHVASGFPEADRETRVGEGDPVAMTLLVARSVIMAVRVLHAG